MSEKNTGGAAFPSKRVVRRDVTHGSKTVRDEFLQFDEGMTLRDYFASQALKEAFSVWYMISAEEPNKDWVTRYSYEIADAMLKARKA